jgi:hypothetical protein
MGLTINQAAVDGLRAWGAQLEHASAQLPTVARQRVLPLDEGLRTLGTVHSDVIHAAGWELTHALAPRNDNLCGQRALVGVHSVAQKALGGDMQASMMNLGRSDGRLGAVLTAFQPRGVSDVNGRRFISHSAPVFQDETGTAVVVDDLVSDAGDSVMPLRDWLRRVNAREEDLVITSALADIPTRGSGGFPPRTRALAPDAWPRITAALADSWNGLPYDRHRLSH